MKAVAILLAALIVVAGSARAQDDNPQVEIMPAQPILAQIAPPEPQTQRPQGQLQGTEEKITVPAGTKLSLALVRSLSFKHTRAGDSVDLQFVFPVTSGSRVVIPPGTYVQGVIEQVTERDRGYGLFAMKLRSAQVIFSTGYMAPISGPVSVTPTYGKLAAPDSPRTSQAPVMAATGATTVPPLPPLPHVGPSPGEIIGISAGITAAAVVAAVIVYHNRDYVMEAGTPVDITLSAPLELQGKSVDAAVQQFSKAPPEIVRPPRRMRTCWTAAAPNFPSTPYPCPY